MNARGALSVALAGVLCAGCFNRPCGTVRTAANALNVACASAGLELGDPALLIQCELATRQVHKALADGQCGGETVKP